MELLEQSGSVEQARIEASFQNTVAAIEATPSTEVKTEANATPIRKEPGSQDQGYRFS